MKKRFKFVLGSKTLTYEAVVKTNIGKLSLLFVDIKVYVGSSKCGLLRFF